MDRQFSNYFQGREMLDDPFSTSGKRREERSFKSNVISDRNSYRHGEYNDRFPERNITRPGSSSEFSSGRGFSSSLGNSQFISENRILPPDRLSVLSQKSGSPLADTRNRLLSENQDKRLDKPPVVSSRRDIPSSQEKVCSSDWFSELMMKKNVSIDDYDNMDSDDDDEDISVLLSQNLTKMSGQMQKLQSIESGPTTESLGQRFKTELEKFANEQTVANKTSSYSGHSAPPARIDPVQFLHQEQPNPSTNELVHSLGSRKKEIDFRGNKAHFKKKDQSPKLTLQWHGAPVDRRTQLPGSSLQLETKLPSVYSASVAHPPTTVSMTDQPLSQLSPAGLNMTNQSLTHLSSANLNIANQPFSLLPSAALSMANQPLANLSFVGLNMVNQPLHHLSPSDLNMTNQYLSHLSSVGFNIPNQPLSHISSAGMNALPVPTNTPLIPDGSGAKRYSAPDVSTMAFDPCTGFRFDSNTGLHYDANSGYFYNSYLKKYLMWDVFTQTYLQVTDSTCSGVTDPFAAASIASTVGNTPATNNPDNAGTPSVPNFAEDKLDIRDSLMIKEKMNKIRNQATGKTQGFNLHDQIRCVSAAGENDGILFSSNFQGTSETATHDGIFGNDVKSSGNNLRRSPIINSQDRAQRIGRSPGRQHSRSPLTKNSFSSHLRASPARRGSRISPGRRASQSPYRRRGITHRRSRSPVKKGHNFSPVNKHSQSPGRHGGVYSSRRLSRSPERRGGSSSNQKVSSRSPVGRKDLSPSQRLGWSPSRRCFSPKRKHAVSLAQSPEHSSGPSGSFPLQGPSQSPVRIRGISPTHGLDQLPAKRSPSPVRRGRTPVGRSRSCVRRSRSPIRRSRSPVRKGRSPVRRGRSPVRRGRSPDKRGRSPVRRGRSPLKSRSPVRRGRSVVRRSKSPVRRVRSPVRRNYSPFRRGRSPIKRSRSPVRRGRSPIRKDRSPVKSSQSVRKSLSPSKRRAHSLIKIGNFEEDSEKKNECVPDAKPKSDEKSQLPDLQEQSKHVFVKGQKNTNLIMVYNGSYIEMEKINIEENNDSKSSALSEGKNDGLKDEEGVKQNAFVVDNLEKYEQEHLEHASGDLEIIAGDVEMVDIDDDELDFDYSEKESAPVIIDAGDGEEINKVFDKEDDIIPEYIQSGLQSTHNFDIPGVPDVSCVKIDEYKPDDHLDQDTVEVNAVIEASGSPVSPFNLDDESWTVLDCVGSDAENSSECSNDNDDQVENPVVKSVELSVMKASETLEDIVDVSITEESALNEENLICKDSTIERLEKTREPIINSELTKADAESSSKETDQETINNVDANERFNRFARENMKKGSTPKAQTKTAGATLAPQPAANHHRFRSRSRDCCPSRERRVDRGKSRDRRRSRSKSRDRHCSRNKPKDRHCTRSRSRDRRLSRITSRDCEGMSKSSKRGSPKGVSKTLPQSQSNSRNPNEKALEKTITSSKPSDTLGCLQNVENRAANVKKNDSHIEQDRSRSEPIKSPLPSSHHPHSSKDSSESVVLDQKKLYPAHPNSKSKIPALVGNETRKDGTQVQKKYTPTTYQSIAPVSSKTNSSQKSISKVRPQEVKNSKNDMQPSRVNHEMKEHQSSHGSWSHRSRSQSPNDFGSDLRNKRPNISRGGKHYVSSHSGSSSSARPGEMFPSGQMPSQEGLSHSLKYDTDPLSKLFDKMPTNFVLVKPSPPVSEDILKEMLMKELDEQEVPIIKVISSSRYDTGAPYNHAHVIFKNPRDAISWFTKYSGCILLPNKLTGAPTALFLYYSVGNWKCLTCNQINFTLRSLCAGCFSHKSGGASPVTLQPNPTRWVGIYKLKLSSTKESVMKSFPLLEKFPLKNMKVINDSAMNCSAGLVTLEIESNLQAKALFTYLKTREDKVVVDGSRFCVSYVTLAGRSPYKNNLPQNPSLDFPTSNIHPIRKVVPAPDGSGRIKYPVPDGSKYKYDSKTKLFYDPFTTLYYNPNTNSFYNQNLQIFLRYDDRERTYFTSDR